MRRRRHAGLTRAGHAELLTPWQLIVKPSLLLHLSLRRFHASRASRGVGVEGGPLGRLPKEKTCGVFTRVIAYLHANLLARREVAAWEVADCGRGCRGEVGVGGVGGRACELGGVETGGFVGKKAFLHKSARDEKNGKKKMYV